MNNNEEIQAMIAPFIGVVPTEKIDAGVRFLSAINAAYTSTEPVAHTVGDEFVGRINKLTEKEKEQFFKEFKGEEDTVKTGKKTFAEQCSELHDCLPVNPTKDALTELHNQMIDRITELQAQLADAKQVANDCRIVADNAIAEALGAKKDAERYREALEFVLKVFEPCKADYIFSKRLALTKARSAIDSAIQAEGKQA